MALATAVTHVARSNLPKGVSPTDHPHRPGFKVWFTPLLRAAPCLDTRYPGFLLQHFRKARGVGKTAQRFPAPVGLKLGIRLAMHLRALAKAKKARPPHLSPHDLRAKAVALQVAKNAERRKARRAARLFARKVTNSLIARDKIDGVAPKYLHATARARLQ